MTDNIKTKSQLYVTIEHVCIAREWMILNALLDNEEYTCCPKCGKRWRRVGEEVIDCD